jgi:hypothetical protein
MPTLSSTTNAQTTLLAGSGVVNGMMIANVKYTYSGSTLDPTSTSSRWIASWKTGSSLNTKSQSASLTQHDTYAQFTFDLTQASIATDSNPFVAPAADSSSSTGAATTGTGAGSSKASTTVGGVTTATSGSSSGGSSSSGGVVTVNRSQVTTFQHAHGVIMAGAMVVVFPLGAIIFRTFGGVWLHAGIQILGLVAIIAGLGLGIKLAQLTNLVSSCNCSPSCSHLSYRMPAMITQLTDASSSTTPTLYLELSLWPSSSSSPSSVSSTTDNTSKLASAQPSATATSGTAAS